MSTSHNLWTHQPKEWVPICTQQNCNKAKAIAVPPLLEYGPYPKQHLRTNGKRGHCCLRLPWASLLDFIIVAWLSSCASLCWNTKGALCMYPSYLCGTHDHICKGATAEIEFGAILEQQYVAFGAWNPNLEQCNRAGLHLVPVKWSDKRCKL